jgi:hypothetical protein
VGGNLKHICKMWGTCGEHAGCLERVQQNAKWKCDLLESHT